MIKFKSFFASALLILALAANAQTFHRDSLVGVWLCEEASLAKDVKPDSEEAQALKMLKSAVVSSKFLFKSNGLFEWQFPKGIPAL